MSAQAAVIRVLPGAGHAISPHLFGGLAEHFGRGMYGGLWDHQLGLPRADVKAAILALGTTMLRYPGGCFSDWYHWKDGIGPAAARPFHPRQFWTDFRWGDVISEDLAQVFGPAEDNMVGTDEFLRYCVDLGIEPYLQANYGSGTSAEAAAWVRYTNRAESPRPVKWWGIGNEIYGDWSLGHSSAASYAQGYLEFAAAMRDAEPSVKLVAVGCGDPTEAAADWNRVVLEGAGDALDSLSVHWYYPSPSVGRGPRNDQEDYLRLAAGPDLLGRMLDGVIDLADGLLGPRRKLQVALDEWNQWFVWEDLVETNHRLADAVFFAGCWTELIRHCDRVTMAMLSHQVNCMAPIQTRDNRMFTTSSYLVAQLYRRFCRAYSVPLDVACERISIAPFEQPPAAAVALAPVSGAAEGEAAAMVAAATADAGGTTIFITNRNFASDLEVTVHGAPDGRRPYFRWVTGSGPWEINDENHRDRLRFAEVPVERIAAGSLRLVVSAHTAGALVIDSEPNSS